MRRHSLPLALAALLAAGCAQAAPPLPRAPEAVSAAPNNFVDEVARIVEKDFYSTAVLEQSGWKTKVQEARAAYAQAKDGAARTKILRDLLASLHTSHTAFYPTDDPGHAALASIFEHFLVAQCPKDHAPSLPVTQEEIGVFWKNDGGRWFVGGVLAGGPAEAAGLVLGDEVVGADGKPFAPVLSFAGKTGSPVALEVRRKSGGAPITLHVTPRRASPQEAFREATEKSYRVVERNGKRIAYVRLWSWTSMDIQETLMDAIAKANREKVDGYVVDLRDGFGGANPWYLSIFFRDIPRLESIPRGGAPDAYDTVLRKNVVLIVNEGTRSGKEIIAFGAKKHGLARLVGERTAGAVVAGRPYCLSDGSILYLAVADVRIDGERLEGSGVAPDVVVPFDFRHAEGKDPQLEKALDELTGG